MTLVFERGGEKLEPLRVKREFLIIGAPYCYLPSKNNAKTTERHASNPNPKLGRQSVDNFFRILAPQTEIASAIQLARL